MDLDEICVRSRQALAKRCDAILYRAGLLRRLTVECDGTFDASNRFFFSTQEVPTILARLRKETPEVVEEIVQRGERICRHRFDLLGYEGVYYGPHIDWHLDAVHGKRAPRSVWFRVRYLDFDQVGDSKIIWELNRHQHLVVLAKAYRLTGDTRYALELLQQWYHWQCENPYPIGINWASSLEVAFRSLSWLWVWQLLLGCSVVPAQFGADLWQALARNGRHIERFLSTYFSPNTHLLGEAVGLFFIGTLCQELASARRWQSLGWQIILREAQRQVRADGMHFEQSLYYHTYALDFFLHARILAEKNGIPVPTSLDRQILKMLEVLCSLGKARPLPRWGDDDGGRVFDSLRNRNQHLTDPLAIGTVLYNRPDFRDVAGNLTEEAIWLLGPEHLKHWDKHLVAESRLSSFALAASGIHVLASSDPVRQQLVIDVGPHGGGRGGHGHADALSVQVAIDGQDVLIDPGTFVYVDQDGERDRFRSSASHNTITVDGISQAETAGPFGWRMFPEVRMQKWISQRTFDLFEGSHDGFSRLKAPVKHRRHVFYLKPHFWLIRDVLEGVGAHEVSLYWHFAPGSLSTMPEGFRFVNNHQTGLDLLFTSQQKHSHRNRQGWCSPVYGKKEPCPVLQLNIAAQLPMETATLLAPLRDKSAKTGKFRRLQARQAGVPVHAYQYVVDDVCHHMFFAECPGAWLFGGWASDARFVYCAISAKENVRQLVVCDGSYLMLGGKEILSSNNHRATLEWVSDESQQHISSEAAKNGQYYDPEFPAEDRYRSSQFSVMEPSSQ